MANYDITLKRWNGTTYDKLFPRTHFSQVFTDDTLVTDLGTHLTNTYIPLTQRAATNGVATLDSTGKVPFNQIPDAFIGGLKFRGSLSVNKDLDDYLFSFPVEGEAIGSYYIATADITISSTSGNVTIKAPGDEGDFDLTDGIDLEAGDWLVVTGWVPGTSLEFAIINNTYAVATDTAKGLVTLSSATDTTGTTSKVITESILGGLIGTAANTLAAGDHLHDDRYYLETEINDFFAGNEAISGYNKANWDTAYGDKIDSASFADGTLTLTRQDAGTVTVTLDGRYVESISEGSGIDVSNTGQAYTIAHEDTSTVADVTNTGGNVIQSMTFDTFGHLQTHTSTNLDDRYYTQTKINNWISGTETINNNTYVPIIYGVNQTTTIQGTLYLDTGTE